MCVVKSNIVFVIHICSNKSMSEVVVKKFLHSNGKEKRLCKYKHLMIREIAV